MSGDAIHSAQPNGVRLLIVEPERAYLSVLARRLTQAGFKVGTADSTSGAIAEFYLRPPDLILSELKGRGINCTELVEVVRSDPVHCAIPILLLAGKSDRSSAAAAFRSGADGVIGKPFHFEVLVARIEREIQRKHAFDQLREANFALDARITERAIAIGELKERVAQLTAERLRVS